AAPRSRSIRPAPAARAPARAAAARATGRAAGVAWRCARRDPASLRIGALDGEGHRLRGVVADPDEAVAAGGAPDHVVAVGVAADRGELAAGGGGAGQQGQADAAGARAAHCFSLCTMLSGCATPSTSTQAFLFGQLSLPTTMRWFVPGTSTWSWYQVAQP